MDPAKLTGNNHRMSMDIEHVAETPPPRPSLHRRAHSDTTFRLDDVLLFDPSDLDLSSLELPNPTPQCVNVESPSVSDESNTSVKPKAMGHHLRSLSVDSDFFEGLSLNSSEGGKRVGHRHSNSMDAASFEVESLMGADAFKKAMAPDKLAELALIDPKRAKRILANRQSAARSKERKVRYTSELERKVQTLQTEATTLSAQVTLLQRDTSGLTVENKELKLRLQAMEQQAELRDALNEKLKEEVQRLKIATGQIPAVNGSSFNPGMAPRFPPHQPAFHQYGIQLHPNQQQQQLHMSQSSANTQTINGQLHPNLPNFSQRA